MKKIFVPLICICLLFSLIRPFPVLAAQKEQTKRAIAIVFDNSASMYERDGKAQYDWCRAIYATEVFGSMANKGDEIRVIPMNPLSIGSKDYRMDSPIIIQGGDDFTFLRDMYTEGKKNNGSLGTPIESLQVAHEELSRMSGDEKWLIVLTDGDQFQENKMPLDGDKTKQRLSTVLTDYNKSENVIFLGVGSQTVLPDVKKTGTYNNIVAKADNTEDVLSMLTQMCNAIYGRDQLSVSGEGMSFDLPMDKLIIFVQGSDLNDMKLIDQSGQVVKEPVSTTRPIYGEKGMDRDGSNWLVDYNLSGLIVTYEDIPAGNYRIQYSGTGKSASAYYEPKVSMTAYLTDENGQKIEDFSHLYPGNYRLHYGLVDDKGEMTESPLLGSRQFTVNYKTNGTEKTANSTHNDSLELNLSEGDSQTVVIEGAYLSGYSIRKEWGITVDTPPAGTLEIRAEGGSSSYAMLELEDKGAYTVSAYYEGQPVDLKDANVTAAINGEGGPKIEFSNGTLQLKYNGSPKDTLPGKYTISLNGHYENEYGKISEAEKQITFDIAEIPAGKLELRISGVEEEITIPDLEAKGVFTVEALYDGKPVTDLENLDVQASVSGDNAPEVEYREGKIYLKYHNTAEDTASGDFEMSVTGSYKDEYDIVSQAEAVSRPFKISDVRDKLEIEYELKQSYFVASSLDKSDPIKIRLKKNGTLLQGDELAAADVKVDTGGVGHELTLSADQSCYELQLNSSGNKDHGKHMIHTTAGIKDEVGRPVNAEKNTIVKFGALPQWVYWAIVLGALALIAAGIWTYMNQKILPDQITYDPETVSFVVGGKVVKGDPNASYNGKGKNSGDLTITAPSYLLNPLAQASFRLTLKAVDPRRIKSSKRRAQVTGRSFPAPTTKTGAEVGPKSYSPERPGAPLVMDDIEPGTPEPVFNISNGNTVSVDGRAPKPSGRGQDAISFSVDLRFK